MGHTRVARCVDAVGRANHVWGRIAPSRVAGRAHLYTKEDQTNAARNYTCRTEWLEVEGFRVEDLGLRVKG